MNTNSNSRPVQQHRIENVLTADDRSHAVIAVGENRRDVPSVSVSDAKLTGIQKWFAEAQLGHIERVSQTRRRQMVADASAEVLRERLEAVVTCHRELLRPALDEIKLLAEAVSRRIHRDADLREQQAVTTDTLRAYEQYREAIARIPDNVDDDTRKLLLTMFGKQFHRTITAIEKGVFSGWCKNSE